MVPGEAKRQDRTNRSRRESVVVLRERESKSKGKKRTRPSDQQVLVRLVHDLLGGHGEGARQASITYSRGKSCQEQNVWGKGCKDSRADHDYLVLQSRWQRRHLHVLGMLSAVGEEKGPFVSRV